MIINTNPNLFLGKRKFNTKKYNKELFLKELEKICKILDPEIKLNKTCKQKLISNDNYNYENEFNEKSYIINILDTINNNLDEKIFEELNKDIEYIKGSGFCIMNWEYLPMNLVQLDNGFVYLGFFVSSGDDALRPIYNIIYFDETESLRLYCPYYGNLVNVGAKCEMCSMGGYENEEEYEIYLFEKHGINRNLDDQLNYLYNFFILYGKENGIEDFKKDDIDLDDIFNFCYNDMIKINEDIKSNCNII